MQITVNGQQREALEGLTVAELLRQLAVVQPYVAVEINEQLVPRAQHAARALQPGDRLEVVTLVGGG